MRCLRWLLSLPKYGLRLRALYQNRYCRRLCLLEVVCAFQMCSKLGDRFSQKLSGHASTDNLSQLTIEISHRRTPPILTDKLNTARSIDLFP